jgi:exonuclease SbcD
MKFIHTADWHIDAKLRYGKLNPETGLNSRFEDQLLAVAEIGEYAVASGIRAVVVAGDIFNHAHPDSKTRTELVHVLRQYDV